MRLNLKLSQKGILLIAIPLIFEFVFVLSLMTMVSQAEAERLAETHSKAVVKLTSDMTKYLFDGASAIVAWHVSKSNTFFEHSGECAANIGRGVTELRNLTAEDPVQQKSVRELAPLADGVCNLLMSYRQDSGELAVEQFRREMVASYSPYLNKLHQIAGHETLAQKDIPQAELKRKEHLRQFLIAGLGINVLIAVLLALVLKSVTDRLQLLMKNARLVAEKEALPKRLSGSDEVSELDRVFHEMAEALKAVDQRKQEFVATICHDLRAPLASVQATLALASKGKYGELNERGQAKFDNAERNIGRLIELLNELLDIERMHAGLFNLELDTVDIDALLAQSADQVKASAEKQNLRLVVGRCEGQILADESRLLRVIVNLLSNAIKFSPPGGSVKLTAEQKTNFVVFRVEDQGKGIAPTDQSLIFDRFQRGAETTVEGAGLGLTICRGIVEAHGGQIGLESEPGRGSTFWFRLPTKKTGAKKKQ